MKSLPAAVALAAIFVLRAACAFPEPPTAEGSIADVIARLDADSFAERERATEALKRRGRSIVPRLEAALERADSPEVRFRLRQVLAWYALRIEWYTDRTKFLKRLGARPRVIDFDDLDTARTDPVSFRADRYVRTHGVRITGKGGQYASRSFGFPGDYPPRSGTNMYAPGPTAPRAGGKGSGGYETDVTFVVGEKAAAVTGFGVVFIDADHPHIGPCTFAAFDSRGRRLGIHGGFGGANGSQLFIGAVAVDREGNRIPAIARVHLVNGCNWAGVDGGEGTTLDDFVLPPPVPVAEGGEGCCSPEKSP